MAAIANLLRTTIGGVDVRHLRTLGTVGGVRVDLVAGLAGDGAGAFDVNAGRLAWRPPGAPDFGPAVDVTAGGAFALFGPTGWDDAFAEVYVSAADLPDDGSAVVYLRTEYHNAISGNQVDPDSDVRNGYVQITNASATDAIENLKIWIDADSITSPFSFELSGDGISYAQPTSETDGDVITIASIAAGGSAVINIRRTCAEAHGVHAGFLALFHCGFDVDGERAYQDWRGRFQARDVSCYRFYRRDGSPPQETDTPYATASALPATPATEFPDGDWYISVSYFNGWADSGFYPIGPNGEPFLRLPIASGAAGATPPADADAWSLELAADGNVTVAATYSENGDARATAFAVAYTVDGSDPAADNPDLRVDIPDSGIAAMRRTIPGVPVADGATVKVLLQMVRDGTPDAYSSGEIKSATADAAGPDAGTGGRLWPGTEPAE